MLCMQFGWHFNKLYICVEGSLRQCANEKILRCSTKLQTVLYRLRYKMHSHITACIWVRHCVETELRLRPHEYNKHCQNSFTPGHFTAGELAAAFNPVLSDTHEMHSLISFTTYYVFSYLKYVWLFLLSGIFRKRSKASPVSNQQFKERRIITDLLNEINTCCLLLLTYHFSI